MDDIEIQSTSRPKITNAKLYELMREVIGSVSRLHRKVDDLSDLVRERDREVTDPEVRSGERL